jgi:hypothetical protein
MQSEHTHALAESESAWVTKQVTAPRSGPALSSAAASTVTRALRINIITSALSGRAFRHMRGVCVCSGGCNAAGGTCSCRRDGGAARTGKRGAAAAVGAGRA